MGAKNPVSKGRNGIFINKKWLELTKKIPNTTGSVAFAFHIHFALLHLFDHFTLIFNINQSVFLVF